MNNNTLYELPNGTWILLADVRRIEALDGLTSMHVIVWLGNDTPVSVKFESYAAARNYAAELAAAVNAARTVKS